MIESLESRIAPATFVSPKIVTYTDVDGDSVTIKISKALLTSTTAGTIFLFDSPFETTTPQQLQVANLALLTTGGLSIKIVSKLAADGDGLAAVGHVDSTGFDLGKVSIDGDLARINSGDATTSTGAIKSLTVLSMGRYGITTQATGGSLDSTFVGGAGKITVKQDIVGANLAITGGSDGNLRGLSIAGSLIGTNLDAAPGIIRTDGNIGAIKIGKDVVGATSEVQNGSIIASGTVKSVTVRGSILASSTGITENARLSAVAFGPIKIAGDLRGGPFASSGSISAQVLSLTGAAQAAPPADGGIASLSIGGSMIGSDGDSSGAVSAQSIGAVKVGGDIRGGAGTNSGSVTVGNLKSLSVRGSVIGDGDRSGSIFVSQNSGRIAIGGDLEGGEGVASGRIEIGDKLKSINVAGSLIGGFGEPDEGPVEAALPVSDGSGQILTGGDMGPVRIGHDVVGGDGDNSGRIASGGKLLALTISGSVIGGSGDQGGSMGVGGNGFAVGSQISSNTDMGRVKIGHDVRGGDGVGTGHIYADGNLTSLSLGGSITGGSANQSGRISADGDIGAVRIRGGVFGDAGSESGAIVSKGKLAAVRIGLDLASGDGAQTGHIGAGTTLGAVVIVGNVVGNNSVPAVISATGVVTPATDTAAVAIKSIKIAGRIEFGQILAGYNEAGVATNADVQIGKVSLRGDWVASDLAAGVSANDEGGFGTPDDSLVAGGSGILSRIARLTIKGQVLGTTADDNATDHFGIVAELLDSIKVGGGKISLQSGPHNDARAVGITGDFTIREV